MCLKEKARVRAACASAGSSPAARSPQGPGVPGACFSTMLTAAGFVELHGLRSVLLGCDKVTRWWTDIDCIRQERTKPGSQLKLLAAQKIALIIIIINF